jgi:hypothetical protein
MEDIMTSSITLRHTLAAAALSAASLVGAAQANDQAHFRDILKPHGQERSASQKLADGQACGAAADHEIQVIMPVFEKCMRRKGWALDHIAPDPARRVEGTVQNFTDTRGNGHGRPRDDAALQSDTGVCQARTGDAEPAFTRCMAGRGWRFLYAQYAPPRRSWSTAHASSPSSTDIDDEMRRIDQSNQTMQSVNESAYEASIQSSNDMTTAAQQQMQDAISNMWVAP